MMTKRALLSLGLATTLALILGTSWLQLGIARPSMTAAATPSAGDGTTDRSVTVVGRGEVLVNPDLAAVTFGVETSNAELAVAQRENAARTEAVLAKLRSLGIAEQDLQTVGYNISPQYDKDGGQPTGYRVMNSVRATIRQLGTLGATIDATVGAGANRVTGIRFDLADKSQAERQAREAAMRDARAKAEQYAALANGRLGPPLQIAEGGATPQFGTALREIARTTDTPIEPGGGMLAVSVQVSYALQ